MLSDKKNMVETSVEAMVIKHLGEDTVFLQLVEPLKKEGSAHQTFKTAEITKVFQSSAKALLGHNVTATIKYDPQEYSSSYQPKATALTITAPYSFDG